MPTEEPQPPPPSGPQDTGLEMPGGPDPAQESLSQALRTGFNLLRVLMVILLAAYLLSGLFEVGAGQQGLIVHLGKLKINTDEDSEHFDTAVFDSGWHFSWPDPFDEKVLIPGEQFELTVDTFLFSTDEEIGNKSIVSVLPVRSQIDPKVDGTMITGDRSLAHGLWKIHYRIADADRFVRSVGESREPLERLLKRLAENAVVRTVAALSVEQVTRRVSDSELDFTELVRSRIASELDALDSGVVVDKVTADTVEPGTVRDAFVDVTRAQSERERAVSSAREEQIQKLSETAGTREQYTALLAAIEAYGAAQATGAGPERLEGLRRQVDRQLEQAGGDVAVRLSEADSRANEIREGLRQEYRNFIAYREQFRQYPAATAVQLWVEMRSAILNNKQNESFFVPDAGVIEIITNRDEQRLIEADVEAYRRRGQ